MLLQQITYTAQNPQITQNLHTDTTQQKTTLAPPQTYLPDTNRQTATEYMPHERTQTCPSTTQCGNVCLRPIFTACSAPSVAFSWL